MWRAKAFPQDWTEDSKSVRRVIALDRALGEVVDWFMTQKIATLSLLVADYDEAIAFYCEKLGFTLMADQALGPDKRWVLVAPAGGSGAQLLLARADSEEQRAAIGNQAGGRVALFLETDDFARDFAAMSAKGVTFLEAPRHEAYGSVAVFQDLYGNKWDLIEPPR